MAGNQQVVELLVQCLKGVRGETPVDPNHHLVTHPAVGVENLVEVLDLLDRPVDVVGDGEKMKIGTGDQTQFQQVVVEEAAPGFPVKPVRPVHQDDWNDGGLTGLQEGEHFEPLVKRSEPSREEDEGACLLHEAKLAGKEVIEIDQLRILRDDGIRLLFKWKTDVEPEALFGTGTLLGRSHDAVATSGDDHEILFNDPAGEFTGKLEIGLLGTGPG